MPGAHAQDAGADPTPNVEATPAPPVPKNWVPGPNIGHVVDAQGNPVNDESGQPQINGRLTAPQDKTQSPADPVTVYALAGEELTCAVEEVTDTDLWTMNSPTAGETHGQGNDGILYAWTCSGGEFTQATEGDSTKWKAPAMVSTYTITCTMSDGPHEPMNPGAGNRKPRRR